MGWSCAAVDSHWDLIAHFQDRFTALSYCLWETLMDPNRFRSLTLANVSQRPSQTPPAFLSLFVPVFITWGDWALMPLSHTGWAVTVFGVYGIKTFQSCLMTRGILMLSRYVFAFMPVVPTWQQWEFMQRKPTKCNNGQGNASFCHLKSIVHAPTMSAYVRLRW